MAGTLVCRIDEKGADLTHVEAFQVGIAGGTHGCRTDDGTGVLGHRDEHPVGFSGQQCPSPFEGQFGRVQSFERLTRQKIGEIMAPGAHLHVGDVVDVAGASQSCTVGYRHTPCLSPVGNSHASRVGPWPST